MARALRCLPPTSIKEDITMKTCFSTIILFFICTGITVSALADKGPVVAKLNGEPVHLQDVIGWKTVDRDNLEIINKITQNYIAIELMYQDAKDQGLDQDEAFKTELQQKIKAAKAGEVRTLATIYQKSNKALAAALNIGSIPEADLDAFFTSLHGDAGSVDQAARDRLRQTLTQQRYHIVYSNWCRSIIEAIPIAINDQTIPLETVLSDHEAYLTKNPKNGGLIAALACWLAGVPSAGEKPLEDEELEAAKQKIRALTLTVGKHAFKLGDPEAGRLADSMIGPSSAYAFPGLMLHIIAAKARQDGLVDELADHNVEIMKSALTNYMLRVNGITEGDQVEVGDEEFKSACENSKKSMWDSLVKNGDEERAKEIIIRQLTSEKIEISHQTYIDSLLDNADIEYLP
jgi:hypothetical protein